MKSSLFLTAACCVAGSLASPVHKRVYVTDIVVVTETMTVHLPCPATSVVEKLPTSLPEPEPSYSSPPPEPTYSPLPPQPEPTFPSPTYSPEPQPTYSPPPQPTYAPPPQPTYAPPPQPTYAPPAPSQPPQKNPNPNPGTDYKSIILHQHNIHRSNHSATDLTWDSTLEASAKELAESCNYGHNTEIGGGGYGQNIGYQSGYDDVAALITNNMYNDEFEKFANNWGQDNPSNFEEWGHLTQILWKATQHVGCVTASCPSLTVPGGSPASDAKYTVCNYGPPGNVVGNYAENVGKPQGQPIVTA